MEHHEQNDLMPGVRRHDHRYRQQMPALRCNFQPNPRRPGRDCNNARDRRLVRSIRALLLNPGGYVEVGSACSLSSRVQPRSARARNVGDASQGVFSRTDERDPCLGFTLRRAGGGGVQQNRRPQSADGQCGDEDLDADACRCEHSLVASERIAAARRKSLSNDTHYQTPSPTRTSAELPPDSDGSVRGALS